MIAARAWLRSVVEIRRRRLPITRSAPARSSFCGNTVAKGLSRHHRPWATERRPADYTMLHGRCGALCDTRDHPSPFRASGDHVSALCRDSSDQLLSPATNRWKELMSNRADVLMLRPMMPIVIEQLDAAFTLHKLWEKKDPDAYLAGVAPKIRGIAANSKVDAGLMSRCPKLEIVASFGVGYDDIDAQ